MQLAHNVELEQMTGILIIEDDAAVREAIAACLREHCPTYVVTVDSMSEAAASLKENFVIAGRSMGRTASILAALEDTGTGVLLKLRPADMSLHADKPVNHPDGWYRQFEKRSKRK